MQEECLKMLSEISELFSYNLGCLKISLKTCLICQKKTTFSAIYIYNKTINIILYIQHPMMECDI